MCLRLRQPELFTIERVKKTEEKTFSCDNFFFVEEHKMIEQQNLIKFMESEIRRLVALKKSRREADAKYRTEKLKQLEEELEKRKKENITISGEFIRPEKGLIYFDFMEYYMNMILYDMIYILIYIDKILNHHSMKTDLSVKISKHLTQRRLPKS